MTNIVAGISSLMQYVRTLKNEMEKYRIEYCPHPDCGKSGLWLHGHRYRKSDRENNEQTSVNPVPILRFYCPSCKRTCSLLPECIPPSRWYLWLVQQLAVQLFFSSLSFNEISKNILPSRWTISRWIKRLKNQFEIHAFHLKSKWSWLGCFTSLETFWQGLLEKITLSDAMFFLNAQGVFIP